MIAQRPTTDGDYLLARMLNEFTYCPRLFYYEHVDGLFAHNQETVEGELRHSGVDAREDGLPPPEELAERERPARSRSVMLSSDAYGVIAKMDLVEYDGRQVTPVDYQRGRPREAADGSLDAWDTDRIQLALQALILREHGYACDEAIVYYAATKQRVRIAIDPPLVQATLATIQRARQVAAEGRIPPPLADSPKCPRCSLVGICLPDETNLCTGRGAARCGWVQKTLFDTDSPRGATTGVRAGPGSPAAGPRPRRPAAAVPEHPGLERGQIRRGVENQGPKHGHSGSPPERDPHLSAAEKSRAH